VALRSADVTLTADGTVIGTPPFMSPEQCAGRRAGPQSDQYSLGIVAFQMLAGSVPFHADTLAGVMHHHFFTPVPDLTLVRDDLPPLADMPTPAMGALPTIPARPRRLTASMRLAALTAVGLVAVGTAWLLGRPSGAPGPAVGAPVDSPSGRSVPPPRPVIRRA